MIFCRGYACNAAHRRQTLPHRLLCAVATLSGLEKAAKPVADPRERFLPPWKLPPHILVVRVAVRHVGVELFDERAANIRIENLDGDFEVVEATLRVEVV